MQIALLIGLGGFLGTLLRYFSGQWIYRVLPTNFPYATLCINLIGCFIIGLIYGWFEKEQVYSSNWKLMLTAGFCGGFTTFSAFSIESLQMARNGQYGMLAVYVAISVGVGILLTLAGLMLMKQ